ncbi:MAG: hypothetical protein JRI68_12885 [Deltaproteobacteria bacterium]|nr:hypothetical protein [Deltaproteobacteria bacterium]
MRHPWELVTNGVGVCCLVGSLLIPIGGCGGDDRAPACKSGTDCGLGGTTSSSGTGGEGAGGGSTSSAVKWVKVFGDDAAQLATSVALDSQGNIFVAGHYSGMMAFDEEQFPENTAHDIFLAKLDPAGAVLWIHPFGQNGAAPGPQDEINVAVDSEDNVVVTSAIVGDTSIGLDTPAIFQQQGNQEALFAAKLTGDGGFLWATMIGSGGTDVTARGVDCDADGNVYVAGDVIGDGISFQGTIINLGAGGAFVVKLAHDTGMVTWARGYEHSSFNVVAQDIAVDSDGAAVVVGDFTGVLTLQNGELTNIASGEGMTDIFLIKLAAADGAELWAKHYGSADGQRLGHGVALDGQDHIHVAAAFFGQVDFGKGPHEVDGERYDPVVAKLNADTTCRWSVAVASPEHQRPLGIDVGSDNQVVVAGLFQLEMNWTVPALATKGNDDIFVAQLDSEGMLDWARGIGGLGQQWATDVAVADDGTVVFVGWSDGDIELTGDILENAGGRDVVIGSIDGNAPQ